MGVISQLKFIGNKGYVMPFSERDTIDKRMSLLSELKDLLDMLQCSHWFNVICFGSFLTDSYDETSDIDLLVCSKDVTTVYKVKNDIALFLMDKGLVFDIIDSTFKDNNAIYLQAMMTYTWAYKNDVPDEMIEWINVMVRRWGDNPMERFYQEVSIRSERFKESSN